MKKEESFIVDILSLYKRYDLAIGHQDTEGAFLIQPYSEDLANWIKDAKPSLKQPTLTAKPQLVEREYAANFRNIADVQGGSNVSLFNQDCITGMAERVADSSIHLTVTSIPFEELFTYSGKLEDVGNNGSTVNLREGRFALNLRFVIGQLLRVTAPGCNVAIHIQQLLAYKNQHGFIGRRDFRGAVIDTFSAGGFHFIGEFAIRKNPQAMAQRLNLHCLMFYTGKNNSTMLAPAPNDYVLIFQKPGEVEHKVHALYDTKTNPEGWITTDEWIRDAHGVWTDINETDILDGHRSARESSQEKHVCPLQLEVIRRLVKLYTNPSTVQPDVMVLDPFSGIGSTAYVCIELGRNCVGFELKESYHSQALKNINLAQQKLSAGKQVLFSCLDEAESIGA